MSLSQFNQTPYEQGIETLNSILFTHNLDELFQLKPKLDSLIEELKKAFNNEDPSVHKDNIIELIQDLLVTYHDKEQSLTIMKRELRFQKYIQWLAIGLILVIGAIFALTIKLGFKNNEAKSAIIQNSQNQSSVDISSQEKIQLLEEKVQDLIREKEKSVIFMKNLKKENEKNSSDIDKAKEKISYLEGLIRELRIERNFSK